MQQTNLNPALSHLSGLIGEWSMDAWNFEALDPGVRISAQVSFEWHEGGAFVIQRWDAPDTGLPSGASIISCDDTTGKCAMHYFDSRGVSRLYELTFSDGVLMIWREAPGFWQRFTGRLDESGNTITGKWEKSTDDGSTWIHDFDLTYSKTS